MTRIMVVCNALRDTYRYGHAANPHWKTLVHCLHHTPVKVRVLISPLWFSYPKFELSEMFQHSWMAGNIIERFFDWLAITCIHSFVRFYYYTKNQTKNYVFISWPDKSNKVSTHKHTHTWTHARPSNCQIQQIESADTAKQKTTIGRKSAKLQRKTNITRIWWMEIWCNIRLLLLLWLYVFLWFYWIHNIKRT